MPVTDSQTERAGSAVGGTPGHQPGRGGSIPASALFFNLGREDDATALVLRYHYSGRMPDSVQMTGTFHLAGGLFGDCGEAVAACVFSSPPTRWSEPVLELSRMVRHDDYRVPLSKLVSLTISRLRRKEITDLVVSFADWTQRHHGGIYQACRWHYDGQRDRAMDGLTIDGAFTPGRSCNARYGTRSPSLIVDRLPGGTHVEPHYDDGKHLYWLALNKRGTAQAKRLGLRSVAYPKPAEAA